MPRGTCRRHGPDTPCSCGMGNLYRFVEPVTLYLLKVRGRTHGYDLAGALNETALTDSRIEPGALYRTLRRLEENGLVVSAWDVNGAGPARRLYDLTPDGEEHLREWLVVLERMSQSLSRFVADVKAL
ncbi:MAG: PadR family transcriptional regulator [Geobacteraceae bacterium]|nr:PadR family transcriptional regulator [Geobacteraceae bacterium]